MLGSVSGSYHLYHRRLAHEEDAEMHDQALIWNTDLKLQVTSLTARLRDLAGIGTGVGRRLNVSDLWGKEDPFNVAVVAHHWALDGESLRFETTIEGTTYAFELDPLYDNNATVVGVSGRAHEARAARAAHLRSSAFVEAERVAGVGSWYEDLRTGHVTISEGLAHLLDIDRLGSALDLRAFDHPEDHARVLKVIEQHSNNDTYSCDHRVLINQTRVRSVRERSRTLFDDRGIAIARIGSLTDITDFKEREATLTDLAHYDALTRLPNRAMLNERLTESIARSNAQDLRCAVLFVDLDDFKYVNDAYGHAFGDRLLVSVADRLLRHVRGSDMVARLGGDEFVVVIDDLFSDEAAIDAARKLLRGLDEPFVIDDSRLSITASIGVASCPSSGQTPGELTANADAAMYVVKRNGGSGVKFTASEKETSKASAEKPGCQARSFKARHRFATPQSA